MQFYNKHTKLKNYILRENFGLIANILRPNQTANQRQIF